MRCCRCKHTNMAYCMHVNLTWEQRCKVRRSRKSILLRWEYCWLSVFVRTQGARCSGLGSFAVPAPAAGHQRQTRPDGFACRWPHPHRQPETRARKLSLPEGGILPGRASLLHGSERANHPQRRYGQRKTVYSQTKSMFCCLEMLS